MPQTAKIANCGGNHCATETTLPSPAEIFMSETAKFADVIFPATCYAEKEGTFTASERRVQRVRKAVEPPGEARVDWQIVASIAQAMGAKKFN